MVTGLMTERGVQVGADFARRSPLGLYLPPKTKARYDLPVAVDLFAGAGGFGCGMHQAGFHVAAASEVWESAAVTYLVNLARPGVKIHFDTPEREASFAALLERILGLDKKSKNSQFGTPWVAGSGWISSQASGHPGCEHFFLYDVKNLTGELILDALGLGPGDVSVVTGGPPCQGYSTAGKRNLMDPRNSLIFEFARLVCEIQPKTFVMENVPGLLSMTTPEGLPVIDAFCMAVEAGGYGDYDALRRSLMSHPDARAATGSKGGKDVPRPRKPKKQRPTATGGDLLDLLEESS